ncbi:MAG: Ig-like domain-containing protein [Leucobacter sp.]
MSVTGDYSFEDLGAPGNGYIAVLLGPYDPADVSNCLTAVDSTGTVALEAGETYTMLLAGNTGELGDFSFSVDGPGVFSTPVQVSSSVTVSTPVSSVTAGEPVDVTALVSTRFPTADLSGTVEFFADAVSLGTSSVTPGSGSAVLPGVLLPVGTHSITAVYSGNTDAEGSTTTTPTIVTVNPSQVTPTPGTPIPPQRVETASQ